METQDDKQAMDKKEHPHRSTADDLKLSGQKRLLKAFTVVGSLLLLGWLHTAFTIIALLTMPLVLVYVMGVFSRR